MRAVVIAGRAVVIAGEAVVVAGRAVVIAERAVVIAGKAVVIAGRAVVIALLAVGITLLAVRVWALFGGSVLLMTVYLLQRDLGVMEKRLQAGPMAVRRVSQKISRGGAGLLVCGRVALPGVERRFHGLSWIDKTAIRWLALAV
ncbi:MAG TPA: hypothetical protein VH877_01415 [Polyangia bacterium]|nr:hypothetical protein [Polyangia bacterium]